MAWMPWRDRRRPFLFKKTAEVSVPRAWAAKRNAPQLHRASELAPLPTSGDRRSFEHLPRTRITKPSSIWISLTSSPTNSAHTQTASVEHFQRWHGRASPSRPRGSLDRAAPRRPPPIDTPANAQPFRQAQRRRWILGHSPIAHQKACRPFTAASARPPRASE